MKNDFIISIKKRRGTPSALLRVATTLAIVAVYLITLHPIAELLPSSAERLLLPLPVGRSGELEQQERPESISGRGLNQTRKVFIDLGANCGNSFLKFKRKGNYLHGDDSWEVYLWEPSPQMHDYFLNDLKKEHPYVHILPFAAGTSNKEIKLYLHKGQDQITDKTQFIEKGKCIPNSPYSPAGGTSIFADAKVAGEPLTVQMIDFASWLADLNLGQEDRLIMKIDIEGAELELMERMLTDGFNDVCHVEMLAMEFHKGIFEKGSRQYLEHERFEETFRRRFKDKCGSEVRLRRWG